MIGPPPSARKLPAVPADPAEHAQQFALDWWDKLDHYSAARMEELGIPLERIGASDHKHGIGWCAFNPYEREGGSISPGGRINLDSGALNPDLLTKKYGEKAGKLWAKSRYRDRQDALIAHEDAECCTGDHEAALKAAPDTELPISHQARGILRAMKEGWKR
jgi:hypothetical protein